jgi:hypothetical protein
MSDDDSRRNLSLFQIEVLLKTTVHTPHSTKHWLHISDIKTLLTAVEHDADEVYLVQMGRMFKIKYRDDKVWLSPADGNSFAPCGWFSPKALQREVSESVHATAPGS